MKRNRESKYKQKLINCLHKNKLKQKELDKIIQKYGVTYYDMYQFAIKHDYSKFRDMICKMVDQEMKEVFKSFGDTEKLLLDLFEPVNCFHDGKRPYYLGFDFTRGNNWIGKVVLDKKENI